jgi:hypothetical protein
MRLEEAGIPSVAIHTHPFARLAQATALSYGMPTTRQAYVPQPVVDRTAADLRGYIEGTDPVSSRPFMQEIIEGLSAPLTADDEKGATFERDLPRLLEPDTEDNLRQRFEDERWTDFMGIVLPTEERVEAMLKGTSHAPDEIVGRLAPTAFREVWAFDVEKVAVNAVMAGCKPEYLPVLLAMASSGTTARSSSTTSFAGLAVINGPVRKEIGLDDGIGVMGPWHHANVTIGRAWNLLCQNLQGGSVPGDTYMGTLGNLNSFSAAFPEAEERSPWAPLHTQYGFGKDDSAVTVFRGGRYTHAGFGPREHWESKMIRCLTAGEARESPLIVMDPIVARGFVEKGFATKEKLIEWCAKNATLPAKEYWNDQWVQTLVKPLAHAGVEPFAANLKAGPDDPVPVYREDEINIVVTGGETQGAFRIIEGRRAKDCTISIDKWR